MALCLYTLSLSKQKILMLLIDFSNWLSHLASRKVLRYNLVLDFCEV
jgi:hypothetical protein